MRQMAVDIMEVLAGESDLLEIVDALSPPSRLAGRLHRGQQKRDQHADNRDHHYLTVVLKVRSWPFAGIDTV